MRYRPIRQLPFCCVPATLSMILERRGLPVPSQTELAARLGLVVPPEYESQFPGLSSRTAPAAGWGTRIDLPEYSLDACFAALGLPLRYSYHPTLDKPLLWLQQQIAADQDVIACFDYGTLYGGEGRGHVSAVESIVGSSIKLVETRTAGFTEVTGVRLLEAAKLHGPGNLGGFWLISG
jgi:hypothetical protein